MKRILPLLYCSTSVLVVAVTTATTAAGQVVTSASIAHAVAQTPARATTWPRVIGLEPGEELLLTLKGGQPVRTTFSSADFETLTVADQTGLQAHVPRTVPREQVFELQIYRKTMGRAVGGSVMTIFGSGYALLGLAYATSSPSSSYSRTSYSNVGAGIALFGTGLLVGGILLLRKHAVLVYRA